MGLHSLTPALYSGGRERQYSTNAIPIQYLRSQEITCELLCNSRPRHFNIWAILRHPWWIIWAFSFAIETGENKQERGFYKRKLYWSIKKRDPQFLMPSFLISKGWTSLILLFLYLDCARSTDTEEQPERHPRTTPIAQARKPCSHVPRWRWQCCITPVAKRHSLKFLWRGAWISTLRALNWSPSGRRTRSYLFTIR